MTTYQLINAGQNLSQFIDLVQTQHEAIRTFERGPAVPAVKPEGLLWQSTDLPLLTASGFSGINEGLLRWDSALADWTAFADTRQIQINAGGTVPFNADQPMNAHKLTGLAAGTDEADSVRVDQVILRDGSNPMTANLSLGGQRIFNLQDGVGPNDAATRGQLDRAIQNENLRKFFNAIASDADQGGTFVNGSVLGTQVRNGTWHAVVHKVGDGLVGINGAGHNAVKNFTRGDVSFTFFVTDGTLQFTSGGEAVNFLNAIHLQDSIV